jgi:hypothetical protein
MRRGALGRRLADVAEQPLDGRKRALLVRADDAARPALDPAGDAFALTAADAAAVGGDQPLRVVEGQSRDGPARGSRSSSAPGPRAASRYGRSGARRPSPPRGRRARRRRRRVDHDVGARERAQSRSSGVVNAAWTGSRRPSSVWVAALAERRGEGEPREGDLASHLLHATYGDRP